MKKTKIIVASSLATVALIGMGAFAFFSDNSEQEVSGTIGTVKVEGGGLSLSNSTNINPGDEFPDGPADPNDPGKNNPYDPENPGDTTPHMLSFTVANTGTKSIRTRNIIDIMVTSPDGKSLDPTAFALYEKDANGNNLDLSKLSDLAVNKFTFNLTEKDADGNDVPVLDATGKNVVVLRYIIEGASLNGETGLLEDKDITQDMVDRDSVVSTDDVKSVTYDYYLGLSSVALDEYQGASVQINLEVQAMQYRNTTAGDPTVDDAEDGDWTTVLTDTVVSGSSNVKEEIAEDFEFGYGQ